MTAALIVVAACVVALLGVLATRFLQDRRRISTALADHAARRALVGDSGSTTARLVGTTPDGTPVVHDLAGTADRTLLAFLSSSCVTCRGLWAELAGDLPARLPPGTRVLIVTEDRADERPATVRQLSPRDVPVVMSTPTWRRYGVDVAPYFVVVEGSSGRVGAAGTAGSGDELVRLVRAPAGA